MQSKAWAIEEDITSGHFDATLEKYRPKSHLATVKPVEDTPKALTLTELWDKYCEYRKPQVAETTYREQYIMVYANRFKALPTNDLTQAVEIGDYLLKSFSAETAKRTITQLNACCKWALKSNLISENPFLGMVEEIKVTKDDNGIDPFSASERDAIIEAFENHPIHKFYAPFVKFLFMTGCRTGEAIALKWKHINSEYSQILFCESFDSRLKIRKDTKTHKSRQFPCNAKLQELLKSIKAENCSPEDLVFSSHRGREINAKAFLETVWKGRLYRGKQVDGIVTGLVKEGKVERYRCQYNTRHTFISMMLEAHVSPAQVAKWVGNSPEVIMRHYAGTMQIQVPEV